MFAGVDISHHTPDNAKYFVIYNSMYSILGKVISYILLNKTNDVTFFFFAIQYCNQKHRKLAEFIPLDRHGWVVRCCQAKVIGTQLCICEHDLGCHIIFKHPIQTCIDYQKSTPAKLDAVLICWILIQINYSSFGGHGPISMYRQYFLI